MANYNLTGDATFTLNNRVFVDYADEDNLSISFPNELFKGKTGKNGNSIFAKDSQGANATVTLRLLKGSTDDAFMAGLIAASDHDFVGSGLLSGSFIQRFGDDLGNVKSEVYQLTAGKINKRVEGKSNAAGDTNQAVAVYSMWFASVKRSIQ